MISIEHERKTHPELIAQQVIKETLVERKRTKKVKPPEYRTTPFPTVYHRSEVSIWRSLVTEISHRSIWGKRSLKSLKMYHSK